ncbi:spore germination protein GerPE [Bacillus massilinigeriensis]|uniref:spore germination protein GerPE n=1 Tax=Bacillus mediterraneensis TaxID=1805474 RepID=UPI0008F95B79|nr:spore germination protein GerPE [Bacillus mediterraneensis]
MRTSVVNNLKVLSLIISSVIEIGDTVSVHGTLKALAVQREKELFFGNEGNFSTFRTFTEPIMIPPIPEEMPFIRRDLRPNIYVNNIHILGMSSSSVLQIGNAQDIKMEARVKHIRQLLPLGNRGNCS